MTNDVDRSVISMYLDDYIGQFLFEQHNPFKSTFTTRDALEEIITEKIEELKNIPGIKSNMIMLAPASDQLYQIKASTKIASHILDFFGSQTDFKTEQVIHQLRILQNILEKSLNLEAYPRSHLVRWQIVGFEIEHVKNSANLILDDVDRCSRCLVDGDWPSSKSLSFIMDILNDRTPPKWR